METYTIHIIDSVASESDMVDLLRKIADDIEKGFTSGYNPTWYLKTTISDKLNNSLKQ